VCGFVWLTRSAVTLASFGLFRSSSLLWSVQVVVLRLFCKQKTTHPDNRVEESSWGIGVRMIQLIGVLLLVPIIGVLMVEGTIHSETGSALLGVALGTH
jgi:hypothetical protein